MDHINPNFEKYLLSLKDIAMREFGIQISVEKMLHDKSHRDNMLVELSVLNSEVLNQYIQNLLITQPYIEFIGQEDSTSAYLLQEEEEIVVPSSQGQISITKKSKRIWFLCLLLVSCGLLFVWQDGYQILLAQLGESSDSDSAHMQPATQIVTDSSVMKSDPIDKEIAIASLLPVEVTSTSVSNQSAIQSSQEDVIQLDLQDSNIVPENTSIQETESQIKAGSEQNKIIPVVFDQTEIVEIDKTVDDQQLALLEEQSKPVPVVNTEAKPVFKQTELEVYSPRIKRFVLAQGVKNRVPIGSIEDIQFNQANSVRVYAYSIAVGLMNDTLYYIWRLNDTEIARVTVEVGGEHWRSYSSKQIKLIAHGDWSVTLVNKEEEVLAVSRFHY
jgi:hypothetical protein